MFHRFLILFCTLMLLPLYADVPRGTDLSKLNKGNPEQTYRTRVFSAYKPQEDLRRQLKISNYSAYENPTGIYYKAGEAIRVILHDRPAAPVELIIRDFGESGACDRYPLSEGYNKIEVKRSGLGYINYRHPNGCKAPTITVGLRGGTINGIFSRHDDTATWERLLSGASAGILDIVGERCQIAYSVDELRKGAPREGVEMLSIYDRIVELQQKLSGWDAEGIHPGNHILCRVMWRGYMQKDGEGAAFHNSTISGISNPEGLKQGAWGVAHELGHVNQVQPGFCWAGLAEVSNNIYSALSNYVLNSGNQRLEHEVTRTAFNEASLRGGRFDCYVNNAIVKRQLWQFQGGPDSGIENVPGKYTGDHFVSCCPLWQLLLYMQIARGKEDFYPIIFRKVRGFDDKNAPHGQLRANFCRYVSEASGLDMSYFLLRTGMLAHMNRHVHDYGSHMVTITREMVEETVKKAGRNPEPDSSVIYYITGNSVNIYRDKLEVEPSPSFRPELPEEGGNIVIPASEWKNAVAFEVYDGRELVRVNLRGLGQNDNASTTVICPPGATAIRAVQWDGKRYTVTSKKKGKR